MTESWRRKDYYKTRVLIDTDRVLEPQFSDGLLCITGAQLEMLRNLTQYLGRRSTFASEHHDGYYLAPTEAEWDELQAIVADLEETLMGCEELTALFESMVEQLECICGKLTTIDWDGPALAPLTDLYLGDGTLVDLDDNGSTVPLDAERCALAQLVYWQAWVVVVNLIGPLDELLVDLLLPILVGLLGSLAGGPVLGIPAALGIMLVRALIEAKNAGVLPDILSIWEDAEEDVICALYRGLDTGYRQAENDAMKVIVDLPAISPAGIVALHCLVCPWAVMIAKQALDAESEFALEHVEAGYCDDCDEVIGSNWWALYRDKDTNTIPMNHPEGAYWTKGCWQYTVPAGQTCCGVVFQVKNLTGDCSVKRMSAFEAECTGSELWGNQTENWNEDGIWVVAVNDTNVDVDEILATLTPGGEIVTNVYRYAGPLAINAGFHKGWNCTGYCDIHIAWVVFEGTSPP